MKLRKNHVTLIEVLIATVLTMMVLTSITFLYRQVTLISKESERLQKEQFKLTYLEKRLGSIIPTIISPTDSMKDFYFYSSENGINNNPSLVFTYDHGVNLNNNQSNHLLGRLYIDNNKKLILATWISPKRWSTNPNIEMKKEILAEDITDLNFEFYVPPKRDRDLVVKSTTLTEITPENHWHKSWSYKLNQLPPLMKINFLKKVEGKEIPFTFAFSLPKSNLVIVYDETGATP